MKTINDIVKEVEDGITGRVANTFGDTRLDNVDVLLRYVLKAGGGNHLEIGTLFGGSAIAVALLKKVYSHSGIVMCVDPLSGYYGENHFDVSGVSISIETLFDNIEKFDVGHRIVVMKSLSTACRSLVDVKFSTAYIDGDHKNNTPLWDWRDIKNIVTKYVIFDNCDDKFPDVQFACNIAKNEYGWREVYNSGITYVVERQ